MVVYSGEEGDKAEPAILTGTEKIEEIPTLAQSMVKWMLAEAKGKKTAPKQNNQDPSTSRSATQLTGDELLHKFENACYYYRLGK